LGPLPNPAPADARRPGFFLPYRPIRKIVFRASGISGLPLCFPVALRFHFFADLL